MALHHLNRYLGYSTIALTILVSLPLTAKTVVEQGGPLGFEIISLAVLVPLCCYLLFGIAGVIKDEHVQRNFFVAGHVLTIITGLAGYFIFPLYPFWIALAPIALAVAGISSHKSFAFFLLAMLLLAISINLVLLKWELDLGRSIPIVQLFQPSEAINP